MVVRPAMRGFTLLEVLVAMALMAVLALLSWRGLDSVLDSRERLVSASDDLGALSLTFAQLEEDLRRSWSVRLLGLPLPAIAFVPAVPGEGAPRLRLLREASAAVAPGSVQLVEWRLREERLERGFSPWGAASPGAAQAMPAITWQPLMAGIRALELRAFLVGAGWVEAGALAGRPPMVAGTPQDPAPVPVTGVELVLIRADGSRVQRFFTVRD
jgi:general secretion pathway protein J